jgi:predicted transcriptional regulator
MARFTEGELDVMWILWEYGELKPAEIQAHFPRKIKNPALRSYLSILVEKGHVSRRKVGKAYFYKARTRRDRAFRSMLRRVVDTFCHGSNEALIAQLIQAENLSEAELLEIKRLADEMADVPNGSKGRTLP